MALSHTTPAVLLLCCLTLTLTSVTATWSPPSSWTNVAPASNNDVVTVRVGLKIDTEKLDALTAAVIARQLPYQTLDELTAQVAPSDAVIAFVSTWLRSAAGAAHVDVSASRDVIVAHDCPASAVAAAFGISQGLATWRHAASGRTIIRSGTQVPIPAELASFVDIVLGLTDFFESKHEALGLAVARERSQRVTAAQNAPFIAAINGNATSAALIFNVFCKNGAHTDDPSDPCADVAGQPAVLGFTLRVSPDGLLPYVMNVNLEGLTCASVSVRASVTCTLEVPLPAYRRTGFSLVTRYADHTNSTAYAYPTRFAPRPAMTTELLGKVMNIPTAYRRGSNETNSQAIVSFEKQYYSLTDLHAYFKLMDLPFQQPHLVGFNDGSMPGGESTLDVQWVMGSGQGVNTTTWSFPPGDYILNWAWAVGNYSQSPLVTSISYGDTETGYEFKTGYGLQYITRMNTELQKMAVRGFTVLAGSGDAGWTNVGEMGNDLSHTDPTCGIMRAFYPSLSPWVTSMSATYLTESDGGHAAVSVSGGRSWTTGGGFSNHTGVQDFQRKEVEMYLATASPLPPKAMWNRTGRGYPDMAATGDNILCVWNGAVFPLGGTSASGPIAAGLVSLINDRLLNLGLPPVGHLNSLIYPWSRQQVDGMSAFQDVYVGKNNDGDIQAPGSPYPTFCPNGFPTQRGWDAVTGLGVPNVAALMEFAISM